MLFTREQFTDNLVMLVLKIVDDLNIALVSLGCEIADVDEGVGASADCRHHKNRSVTVYRS